MVTEYRALPLNWMDVLEEGVAPDLMPTVEAVAEVLKLHPDGKVIYVTPDAPIYGKGAMGEPHFELAKRMAREGN